MMVIKGVANCHHEKNMTNTIAYGCKLLAMKTILVSTDFSNAAHNALEYAAHLAQHTGSKIILFHAYQRVLTSADMVVMETTDDLRVKCEELLHEEIETIQKNFSIEIEARIAMGSINPTILAASKAVAADFIIVGMKGSGKTVRKLLGSTGIAVSPKSHIPVICVPECRRFMKPT